MVTPFTEAVIKICPLFYSSSLVGLLAFMNFCSFWVAKGEWSMEAEISRGWSMIAGISRGVKDLKFSIYR